MRYKYYLDFGSGYTEVQPFNINLTISKKRDINIVANRIVLEGNLSFKKQDFDNIVNYKNSNHRYINFQIKQLVNTTETIIFDGNANLLTSYDFNRKIVTLRQFNYFDFYDKILNNYDISYSIEDLFLDDIAIDTPLVISETVYAVKVPNTGYDAVQYKKYYDINGRPTATIAAQQDPRWEYFLYESTNADGSHNYQTCAFVTKAATIDGFEPIVLMENGVQQTYYVKKPISVGMNFYGIWIYGNRFNEVSGMIDALLKIIDNSLSFDAATDITYAGQQDSSGTPYVTFDINKLLLGEVSDIAGDGSKGSSISLKKILDIFAQAFDLHWYVDGTHLKFLHVSEMTFSGSIDLTTETTNLNRIEYIDDEIPDTETFETLDSVGVYEGTSSVGSAWGKMQIYYRNSHNERSQPKIKQNKIEINTNAVAMSNGLCDTGKNQLALIKVEDTTGKIRTISGTYPNWNSGLATKTLFAHLNKWRYGDSAQLATRFKIGLISLFEIKSRPLKKIPLIKRHISNFANFDIKKEAITTAGNGFIWSIKQDLNSDFAEIEIKI